MEPEENRWTTVGTAYDKLVEMYRDRGFGLPFPDLLALMRDENTLRPLRPETSEFSDFFSFLRTLPIETGPILSRKHPFSQDPEIHEEELFTNNRSINVMLAMPYVPELLHFHDFFEIAYVVEGAGRFLFEGESVPMSAGDLCIVSPMSRHATAIDPACTMVIIAAKKSSFDAVFSTLLVNDDLLSQFFRSSLYEPRRANYILLHTGAPDTLLHTLQQLVYECSRQDSLANAGAVSLMSLLLVRALRASQDAITLYGGEDRERNLDFTQVLRYIQQNYRTVDLAELSRVFHFSPSYISKIILRQMGRSFTEVQRSLKMARALEYLRSTDMKISEIAEAVGYTSPDHFTRTFRKLYGLTPQEYRKNASSQNN